MKDTINLSSPEECIVRAQDFLSTTVRNICTGETVECAHGEVQLFMGGVCLIMISIPMILLLYWVVLLMIRRWGL